MNRILITGGAGFIGSKLSLKLHASGYIVTVLDNLLPQVHGNDPQNTSPNFKSILESGIRFFNGSVTNKRDWIQALDGQDAIIHLVAMTGTAQSMYEINSYSKVNIDGTALLLDILTNQKHSIKKIVVASSRAIYGEGKYDCDIHGNVFPGNRKDKDLQNGDFECKCPICGNNIKVLPTDEESKINPCSIYGITKFTQEEIVTIMGKAIGIPTVALRYQNVYGPGQSFLNPYTGILPVFSTLMKNGSRINIFEDGKESRDFVYVDDAVNATVLGLEDDKADNEIFNVGSGEQINVKSAAYALRNYFNSNNDIEISGNYRIGDIRHNFADLAKITKLLNFKPKISFNDGLLNFCKWFDIQDIKKDKFRESINELKRRKLYK